MALKCNFDKIECPVPEDKQEAFDYKIYSDAEDKCRPCQLPRIKDLINKDDLPDGEYWSQEREEGMVKVFIKGSEICSNYSEHPIMSQYYKQIDDNRGLISQVDTSQAMFFCVEGE